MLVRNSFVKFVSWIGISLEIGASVCGWFVGTLRRQCRWLEEGAELDRRMQRGFLAVSIVILKAWLVRMRIHLFILSLSHQYVIISALDST